MTTPTTSETPNPPAKRWHGGKWIRPAKRARIHLRDGEACVYCGCPRDATPRLTLDHVVPRERGGDNAASNLVTACLSCNSAKQDKSLSAWCSHVAARLECAPDEIMRRVRNARRRRLPPLLDA